MCGEGSTVWLCFRLLQAWSLLAWTRRSIVSDGHRGDESHIILPSRINKAQDVRPSHFLDVESFL